jgi:signal recognition particle receptor subunit beta
MKPLKVILGHTTSQQVVFVGPFGVGKTTALRVISDIAVVNTDVASSEACANPDAQHEGKTETTAGFDYGEWRFMDGSRVSLIGVPGQERFNTMWDVMLPRSSAIVLWLYGNREGQMAECAKWMQALAERKAIARLAVAVTRTPDGEAEQALAPYRELISRYHPLAPVITADPRSQSDVIQAITMALTSPYAPIEQL